MPKRKVPNGMVISLSASLVVGFHLECKLAPMSSSTAKRIGGEYGNVRATIDVERLNAFFKKHVGEIKTPVDVKQFKVCSTFSTYSAILTGCSLVR